MHSRPTNSPVVVRCGCKAEPVLPVAGASGCDVGVPGEEEKGPWYSLLIQKTLIPGKTHRLDPFCTLDGNLHRRLNTVHVDTTERERERERERGAFKS